MLTSAQLLPDECTSWKRMTSASYTTCSVTNGLRLHSPPLSSEAPPRVYTDLA